MAVYVDPLFQWPIESTAPAARAVARRNGGLWCHLVADSIEELHAMADKLVVRRTWFQDRSLRHYDLTAGKRREAIRRGAVELDEEAACETFKRLRKAAAARRGVTYCRECGCTDDCACEGGCHWVEPDLCSQCADAGV
ncbi:MAG: DUF4031 domain-containing protein [Phycisphaerae bacterium]|nr:DUF4031 domain-containing protein [Phycisphaerae bacterium]